MAIGYQPTRGLDPTYLHKEPDENVSERLPEKECEYREDWDKAEEVSWWFLLDQRVVGTAISDHHDGDRTQADVHNKVLVVTRLSTDLP